jgi:DNA-binding Lrp family transcriptional regulator
MIKAYIMMLVRVGRLESLLKELRKLSNLESIAIVTGDWDIIAKAKVEKVEDLMELTDKIQLIGGIERTTTQVIEKEITL